MKGKKYFDSGDFMMNESASSDERITSHEPLSAFSPYYRTEVQLDVQQQYHARERMSVAAGGGSVEGCIRDGRRLYKHLGEGRH